MEGRQDDGISFLSKTLNDWTVNKLSVFSLRASQNANDEYNRPITNSTFFFPDKQTLIQFFSPIMHVQGNFEVEHMVFEEVEGGWLVLWYKHNSSCPFHALGILFFSRDV